MVLTSREEKKGLEAICKLKEGGSAAPSGEVVFHQLDVIDSASIDSLVEFVSTRFGKLDIPPTDEEELKMIATQNYKLAIEFLETNYYCAKRVTEALIPLLQQSDSARIVNISSFLGLLQQIPAKSITDDLGDIKSLTKDRIDDILKDFLEDFRQGKLKAKGWPANVSAYKMSKAALNAYTRLLAKEFPSFLVNTICPGFVRTDMTGNNGVLTAHEGAESPVHLALLLKTGPSGLFFSRKEVPNF
ncbi:hypothetical protein CDL15_Pgr018777 [Punica granatum]|uniref:(+)-neomenthol dehydrogenase-like n=1 Tax=Punica granatum TaxID=22663 RepID=A0A218VUY3_PUNGR|nr:hypothetical protein CDL15_Pgr018777 [Punica granatum]